MRRLWGRANSSNVMKVIWLLEELQLPYERIDVGGPFGGNDTATYRAMNPPGLVPTLQEDDFTLFESNAILRYLAAAHSPQSTFWPQDAQTRATCDSWMDYQQTGLTRPQSTVFQGLIRTPPDKRDTKAIARAVQDAGQIWTQVNTQLTGQDYIAGPDITLCDFAWGVHVHRWFNMQIDRPDTPRLRAWYDRLLKRPAYANHVAGPIT